jgi:hypothetical protein
VRGVDVVEVGSSSFGLGLAGVDTIWAGMLALRAKATMAFQTPQMKRWRRAAEPSRLSQSTFGNTVSTVAASPSRAKDGDVVEKRPG